MAAQNLYIAAQCAEATEIGRKTTEDRAEGTWAEAALNSAGSVENDAVTGWDGAEAAKGGRKVSKVGAAAVEADRMGTDANETEAAVEEMKMTGKEIRAAGKWAAAKDGRRLRPAT